MSDSNKILLFSDYLFFTKSVELPISIKQKDIDFFVENELESSSPIAIDFLKWSYLRRGSHLLIFASTSERLAQAGHTHEEIDQALYAIPEAGLLAKVNFKDGYNLVKTSKCLSAIYVEKGEWKDFKSMELVAGEFAPQCEAFVRQNDISAYNLYTFDGFSVASFSKLSLSLKGENCESIKSTSSLGSLSNLDIREEAFLKELRKAVLKSKAISYMIMAVPLIALALGLMQFSLRGKQAELANLEARASVLAPEAKILQDLSDQVSSAKNFSKNQLFNALLLARLNDLRPVGITFSKTKANSATDMTIQGSATNLALLNEYVSQLKALEYISEIKSESSSKSAGAKFKLSIKFKEQL